MSELKLIRKFRANPPTHPWITVGPGQDCAIVSWNARRDLAYKIDQVIEGTHFVLTGPGAARPFDVGWKAMAKACSDIAATGFWPVAATVAVNLRKGSKEALAMELYRGLTACCRKYKFGLAGGDLATSEQGLSVVVSLLGEGPRNSAWLRRGARAGDTLLVTGRLGASLHSRGHLRFSPRLPEAEKIRQIVPGAVHACIDITDGLSRDLHHLCQESGVGATLDSQLIPFSAAARKIARAGGRSELEQALGDGEDFELLLAVESRAAERLLRRWRGRVPLTRIGRIERKLDILIRTNGALQRLTNVGYEHR
ncbi:MAG TPA: thiamine-phosphate kinase [Planctomycetota bacterium]|nr:thiamine-phosphate kinase [Planctomycetota bacterium]